jgi:hypothetical protein
VQLRGHWRTTDEPHDFAEHGYGRCCLLYVEHVCEISYALTSY